MRKKGCTGELAGEKPVLMIRYHLMRAVRRPKAAQSWLKSSFFFTWIGISVVNIIAQYGTGWIGSPDLDTQMARMFAVGGLIELL